jgi:hypothetical protein
MLPILIFSASAALLVRFAFLAWRSRLLALAVISPSAACPNMIARASGASYEDEFEKAAFLLRVCPALPAGEEANLMFTRAYHGVLRWSSSFLASLSGGRRQWAEREMAALHPLPGSQVRPKIAGKSPLPDRNSASMNSPLSAMEKSAWSSVPMCVRNVYGVTNTPILFPCACFRSNI